MRPLILIATLALAACGADGPPIPPSKASASQTGPVLSGQVKVGMVGS